MKYYSALKKEWSSNTRYMYEPQKHHAKWNKADTKGQISDSAYMRYLQ